MTVAELIEELQALPMEFEVLVEHECNGTDIAPIVSIDRVVYRRMLKDAVITTK